MSLMLVLDLVSRAGGFKRGDFAQEGGLLGAGVPKDPSEEVLECLELVLTSGISQGGVDVRFCRAFGGGVVVRNDCLTNAS